MEVAIWIIAIVEVVRAIQNAIQIILLITRSDESQVKRATDAFIKSLNDDIERRSDEPNTERD